MQFRRLFFSLLACCVVTHAHLHVVTDPDGTSLQQDDAKAVKLKDDSLKKIAHKATHILAHEVARQLLAERRIAKLKAHLEQAEVRILIICIHVTGF
jgi:hypothetical protein